MKSGIGAISLVTFVLIMIAIGHQSSRVIEGSEWKDEYRQQFVARIQAARSNSDHFKVLSQVGGSVNDVVVQGNYAYIGVGPRLMVLNVSDPSEPIAIGQTERLIPEAGNAPVGNLAATGSLIYALVGGNLFVIDAADPTKPVPIASYYPIDGSLIEIRANRAYVAPARSTVNGNASMVILDISNPYSVIEVGHYDFPSAILDMDIEGNYAYFATEDGLFIVDVTSSGNPALAGSFLDYEWAHAVDVVGNLAYLGYSSATSFRIIDVTDPHSPTDVGELSMFETPSDIAVSGDYAYLGGRLDGNVSIVDIRDPKNPAGAGVCNLVGWFPKLKFDGNHVYVAGRSGGLRIVDVVDPDYPVEVGSYSILPEARRIAISEDHLYVTDSTNGLQVINIDAPEKPTVVGQLQTPEYANHIAIQGSYAYVSTDNIGLDRSSLRIIDISDPSHPIGKGVYIAPTYITDLAITGHYVIAAAGDSGVRVVDISNPENPVETGYFLTSDSAYALSAQENFVYIADGSWGLRVVDISEADNPVEVAALAIPGDEAGVDVYVHRDLLFLSGLWGFGVHVFDISQPEEPTEVVWANIGGRNVVVQGEYLFALSTFPLIAYWLSLPNYIIEVDQFSPHGSITDVRTTNDLVFVTDTTSGLFVMSFDPEGISMPRAFVPYATKGD